MPKIESDQWKEQCATKFQVLNSLRATEGKLFCDIKLRSKDKIDLNAHRNILYAGSGYFHDLFLMKNSKADLIEFDNFNGGTLEKTINFIYTGELDYSKVDELIDITKCANYLQIDELLIECIEVLCELIDDSNCLNCWRLAQECSSDKFEKRCVSHILNSPRELHKNEIFLNNLTTDEMKKLIASHELQSTNHQFGNVLLSKEEAGSKIQKEQKQQQPSELSIELLQPRHQSFSNGTQKFFMISGKRVATISPTDGMMSVIQEKFDVRNFGSTTFNNIFLRCGGRAFQGGGKLTNTCEYYLPEVEKWKYFPRMKCAREGLACAFLDNKIYTAGGGGTLTYYPQACSTVDIFDLDGYQGGQEKWMPGKSMRRNRRDFGLLSLNRSLYAVGGSDDFRFNIEMYDPRIEDNWLEIYTEETGGFNWHCKCVSIGSDIYCFRYTYLSSIVHSFIFDTKMNTVRGRDWIGESYKVFNGVFGVCELEGCINLIFRNEEGNLDFYKYNTNGDLLHIQNEMFYLSNHECIDAFFNLYCPV